MQGVLARQDEGVWAIIAGVAVVGGLVPMLKLTLNEQAWLDEYRKALDGAFPGIVEDILIFGSKARGDSGRGSDLDVLIVLGEADRQTKREVRHTGHLLSALSDAQPSIMVYTKTEWQEREHDSSPFYQEVMRDGVRVA